MKEASAEMKLYPAFTLMEIYDDNLFNEEDREIDEFITRLMPSIALEYQAPRLELDLAYTLDYRIYAKGERDNEDVHFLEGVALFNWKEVAYLRIRDQYSRVSLDSTRDFREESLFENQSNQNILSISPFLQLNPSARTRVETGYQYVDITYEDEDGVDKTQHIFYAEGNRELTSRLTAKFAYRYIEDDNSGDALNQVDYEKQDLQSGARYEYSDNSYVFGTLGYTWIDFANGVSQDEPFWDFGIAHDFRLLVATAAVGVNYVEDPEGSILREESYRLTLTREWSRSRLTVGGSYADFYDAAIDHLDTRRYGGNASLAHELTSRFTGTATFSGTKWEEKIDDTWTRRLIGSLALAYLFAEDLTGTLTWYRIDSHSPQLPDDRFETNRVFLEIRKVF